MAPMKQHAPRIFSWTLAILLPLFAVYPALTIPIEEHAYDAAVFHIYRGVVFSAARADGWLYPRWVQPINAGLGGPLFSFYSPLPYFLMDMLKNFGIPHPLAWRLLIAAALVAASTGTFGLALALFKRADVALLCAAVFAYNSYLLRDLFERGSPQGWAVALFPWMLWLLLRLVENPTGFRFAMAGICWAMIILLHNATALLLLPVLAIFYLFLILHAGMKLTLLSILALLAGLMLTAFYLIPYAAEIQYVQFDNPASANYAQPAANPIQLPALFSPPRVFDMGSGNNAMAEGGGLVHALILLMGLVSILIGWRKKIFADPERSAGHALVLAGGLTAMAIFTYWMQTDSATPVWVNVPALTVFQFRWRLLGPVALGTAVILGYLFAQWRLPFRTPLLALLITFYVTSQLPSLYPDLLFRYVRFPSSPTVADAQAFALESDAPGLTSFNEYLPRWRQLPFTDDEAQRAAGGPIANLPATTRITSAERRTGWLQVKLETPDAFTAAMHILFFPGWVGYVDGKAQTLGSMDGTGYILIDIPAGIHTIALRYEGTMAQHAGDLIGGVTLVLLSFLAVFWRGEVGKSPRPYAASAVVFLEPRPWVIAAIISLAGIKFLWIDPNTTWFRAASTCEAIQGANVHTDIRFGDELRLCGYSISQNDFRPGDLLRITLYWEKNGPMNEPAFSFVHLLGTTFNPDTGNPLWGQQDKETPGEHAITQWTPGKLYRDEYEFRVSSKAPRGDYQIEIGWRTPADERIAPKIIQANDRFSISRLDALVMSGIAVR